MHLAPLGGRCCHRILFACGDFSIGGVGSYTVTFARAFRRRGHSVGILVSEPFGELYTDFCESSHHIEIVRRGLETRTAYLRRLAQRIEALQPDVIINSALPMVQAVMPYLPQNLLRISMVHSIMEHEPRMALTHGPWVDWVVAVSDNVRERVDRQNLDGVKVATIPVGLEIPAVERRQACAASPLRLIYVGRISPEKNLPGLLQVLVCLGKAALPFSMTIVGDGPELPGIRRQAHQLPCGGRTEFLGARSPREVGRLLDAHDFLLMTSHFEGTPHAALEAMAHGLIVVASRLSGSTDRIITHGVDGFLCDREAPEEFAGVLQRFADRPSEFGAISAAARASTLSRYSADALAAQYEALFDRGLVRVKMEVTNYKGRIRIPSTVAFPGIVFQAKHRAVDLWRWVAHGKRAVRQRDVNGR